MKIFVKAGISIAAFAAMFILPSVAFAGPLLTAPTGTAVTAGTNIIATLVQHASTSASATTTVTESLRLECATASLTGKIVTNSGNHIEGELSAASFSGEPGKTHGADCSGGILGPFQKTANPTHNGFTSLPWCITANTADDKFTVSGTCGTGRPIMFQLDFTGSFSCTYAKTSVTGTYTTHPADAILTIQNQEFTRVTSSSAFCPASGKLDMAFTLTKEDNGGDGEVIYID